MSQAFAFGNTYQTGTGCPAVEAGIWSEVPANALGVIVRYDDILQHEVDRWRGEIDEDTARAAFLQALAEFERDEVAWNRDMPPAIDAEQSREWGQRIADRLGWERTANQPALAVA